MQRRHGKEFNNICVISTVKHGANSIIVLGCIGAKGFGELHMFDGKVTSDQYVSILNKHLNKSVDKIFILFNYLFQQNNTSCHTSRNSMDLFQKNETQLLPWLAQLSNLIPIESIWSLLKKMITKEKIKLTVELRKKIFPE